MRQWYGLIHFIIIIALVCSATAVAYAKTDIENELANIRERWIEQGIVEVNLPVDIGFTQEQLVSNLAQMGSHGFITGTDPLGFAFAYQALSELLDGRALDATLLTALESSDATVRSQAARALAVFFERKRQVCAPDSQLPAGCSSVGVFYNGNRISYLVNQLQHELGQHKTWNTMEFLKLSRNIRSVIEDTSIEPQALVTQIAKKMLLETDLSAKQGLATTVGSYLASSSTEGVKVLIETFDTNLGQAQASIADTLVLALADIDPEETVKAQAWVSLLDALELKESIPALGLLLSHPNFNVAWRSAETAAWLAGKGQLVTRWISALKDSSATVRWAGARVMEIIADNLPPAVATQVGDIKTHIPTLVTELLKLLDDNTTEVRWAALRALELWIDRGVSYPVEPFISILKDTKAPEDTRAIAARIVAKIRPDVLANQPDVTLLQSLHSRVPIYKSKTEGYNTFRIPAIVRTAKGTLLAFAEGRRNSASDTGDIDVVLKRSYDQGQTWSPLQVIWSDGTNTSGNPTPVIDESTGRIWLFMAHNNGQDTEAEISAGTSIDIRTIWSAYSDDDGATWSKPRNMFREVQNPDTRGDTMGPGIGIQLLHGPHQGRLVLPALGRIVYSDDYGQSWHQGGRASGTNESQVVELSDGQLLRNDRPASWSPTGSVGSRRALAVSLDQGETWGSLRYPPELVTPYVQGSIVRYRPADASGVESKLLVFSNPANETLRYNMSVWVSTDEGTTWPISKQIHQGPSAYSCLVPLQDGTIGILYEGGKDWAYENIYWVRFSMDWLLNNTR